MQDAHLLGLCAIVTICMQLFFFFVAYTCKFDKVTDFAGSSNFIVLAILTLVDGGEAASRGFTARPVYVTALVCVCRAELALYLLMRVLKRKKDARFDEMREHFLPFLSFWIFQMLWAWGVSTSFIYLNADPAEPAFEWRDVLGIVLWAIGFVIQVAADAQKSQFRDNPANKDKFCDVGVWSVSRHPNYFGEMMIWWGVFTCCTPVYNASADNYGYVGLLSPLLTMAILLLLSGIPSAEGSVWTRYMKTDGGRTAVDKYRKETSCLIPLPKCVYRVIPLSVKRVLLFEWSMYEPPVSAMAPLAPESPK